MLRAKVNADAGLQAQLKNGATFLEVARAAGSDISESELQAGLDALNSADADLSDFELEMISGGAGIGCANPHGHGENEDEPGK